jgi:Ca-activated chloride channel family protein
MRRFLSVLTLVLLAAGPARAQGLLIPKDNSIAPLELRNHEVKVDIEDQVAVTHVTQTFYNSTGQQLEATYVFPVPKGASVQKFTMWVDGKEVAGELVEADKARAIYTDVVRRMKDPGLLEYLGNNLLRVSVYPVPAHGEQKLTLSFTAVAENDSGTVEYLYPLKADAHAAAGTFTLDATLKAQHPLQNIYSPTHAIKVDRLSDREARVHFTSSHASADKDFRLYYTSADRDVGLTALMHRPVATEDGYFMMLISPRAELSRTQHVSRDMVFVLDTSGSMAGKRIQQARAALKFCLRNLDKNDRFGLIHFATTVTNYSTGLSPATADNIERATEWVDRLEAVGSTNIEEALDTALAMRTSETLPRGRGQGEGGRNFTIVFFTDGQPTIGECDPQKLVKGVVAKNTADTRIFTFGVGDDVNAVLLDQIAEQTRSVATYVREQEDIEAKVSSFYAKISHPVLTNLRLTVGEPVGEITNFWHGIPPVSSYTPDLDSVKLAEIYPPQLPDLFHGSQLVVLGRFTGKGPTTIKLTGKVGRETKEFEYEVDFAGKTNRDRAFVEDLWARRKVGYLLDQIRVHGENKELKDEVVSLAKRYGITTPYTSYLVVPDSATPVARAPVATRGVNDYDGSAHRSLGISPNGLVPLPAGPPGQRIQYAPIYVSPQMQWATPSAATTATVAPGTTGFQAVPNLGVNCVSPMREEEEEEAEATASVNGVPLTTHSGKTGVDLALQLDNLRNQDRVARATVKTAAGRACVRLNGVWTDQGFDAKLPVVKIKAQSDAYFRVLERHGEMAEVFRLGNRVVWVTPSRSVLVIDPQGGIEQMSDEEIDRLFVAVK